MVTPGLKNVEKAREQPYRFNREQTVTQRGARWRLQPWPTRTTARAAGLRGRRPRGKAGGSGDDNNTNSNTGKTRNKKSNSDNVNLVNSR